MNIHISGATMRHFELTNKDTLRIEIEVTDGLRIEVTDDDAQPHSPAAGRAAQPRPPTAKTFSPIEEAILKVASREWMPASYFAEKTGQKLNQWLYAILGNLVDRGFLESGRSGYRSAAVAPPSAGDPVSDSSTDE